MSDPIVGVAAGEPVTVKLSFQGIANHYEASLYAPKPGTSQWMLVRTLETDGSSEDARPDEFTFDPPAVGASRLFVFQSAMTAAVVPGDVGVTARVEQRGEDRGEVPVTGHVTTFVEVVLRLLVVAS